MPFLIDFSYNGEVKGGVWVAQVTCFWCKVKGEKSTEMVRETNKKYYHIKDCHNCYIEDKRTKKEENEKWSLLYEYIKSLHDIIIVPPRNIKRLQDLRNGTDFKDGKSYKRYKQGVPYDLMLEAYKLSEDKIKWFIKNVLNGGKDASDINKCITMMLNSLNVAWAKKQHRIKQREESIANRPDDLIINENTTYMRKEQSSIDITDFL